MKIKDCLYKSVCQNTCSYSCIRYNQMKSLLELSNIPDTQQKKIKLYATDDDRASFERLNKIKNNICKFVNNGKNLYICSQSCGNGKTTWAIKIMLKYFDLTWQNSFGITRGLFVHIPTLLLDLKRFGNEPEYINRLLNADLVIWDDIAFSTKLTDYEHEQLLHFIDYRITNNKSNIYTSNVISEEDLATSIGERLASRIYNGSTIVKLISIDYRKNSTKGEPI